jgi:hypothetical protein
MKYLSTKRPLNEYFHETYSSSYNRFLVFVKNVGFVSVSEFYLDYFSDQTFWQFFKVTKFKEGELVDIDGIICKVVCLEHEDIVFKDTYLVFEPV